MSSLEAEFMMCGRVAALPNFVSAHEDLLSFLLLCDEHGFPYLRYHPIQGASLASKKYNTRLV